VKNNKSLPQKSL